MGSVANLLRDQTRAKVARMTPAERLSLALRLGDEDAALLASARGVSIQEARRIIKRSRALGRLPSCASEQGHTGPGDGADR